ncbi:hypothetical protein [Aristophania vespae]|uniref:hypothetical protein n=1 Tax=Aristophania vespae TaxID=2697033 RepID=UPI00235126B3|nr:hypothetical protein [Aristophania vespae]UMM63794.1 hypothetical protein DM15PD_07710 [Aristophania vespae]
MKTILAWLAQNILPLLTKLIEPAIIGLLSKYNTAAQVALRAALNKSDKSADQLLQLYRSYETSHPLVKDAMDETTRLLKIAGITMPRAELVETHMKAAIHDVASVFLKPEPEQKSDITSEQNSDQKPGTKSDQKSDGDHTVI